VICTRCATAADRQLGPEQHCSAASGPDAPCTCQHRTDRYRRSLPSPDKVSVTLTILADPPAIAEEIRDLRRHGLRGR